MSLHPPPTTTCSHLPRRHPKRPLRPSRVTGGKFIWRQTIVSSNRASTKFVSWSIGATQSGSALPCLGRENPSACRAPTPREAPASDLRAAPGHPTRAWVAIPGPSISGRRQLRLSSATHSDWSDDLLPAPCRRPQAFRSPGFRASARCWVMNTLPRSPKSSSRMTST